MTRTARPRPCDVGMSSLKSYVYEFIVIFEIVLAFEQLGKIHMYLPN